MSPACLLKLRPIAGGAPDQIIAGIGNEALALRTAGRRSGFFVTGTAEAAHGFRVIQWDFTRIQIYDFGIGGIRPIPSNYRVLTPPLPSFRAALHAKNRLARRARCSI